MTPEAFSELPPDYRLLGNDVHVWCTHIGWSSSQIRTAAGCLSPAEREKADRFHFRVDAERHIVGRSLARLLLGHLLRIPPDVVCFHDDAFGKPRIVDAQNELGLRFNISHSGDFVIAAFAIEREVGVDVEKLNEEVKAEQIAARMFSERERDELASLPPADRHRAFFRCWSRKEAFLKATGKGLSLPLDQFNVSLRSEEPVELLATKPNSGDTSRWTIRDLNVGPEHAAAIAAEGFDWQLRMMEWLPPTERCGPVPENESRTDAKQSASPARPYPPVKRG